MDDAYITFRYAQNLVHGIGPNYNPGERVEGYSSPSFMLLMAGAIAVGIDPVPVAKVLGLASSLLLLFVLYFSLRRVGVAGGGAALATLLLGSSMVLQIWSAAGLETNLYALLFFCGLVSLAERDPEPARSGWASSLLAAAALTRPEGIAFWGLGLVFVLRGTARLRNGVAYFLPGLLLLAHFLWRLAYYGAPLPNTYYVKTGGGIEMWKQGLAGLGSFVASPSHSIWIVAAAAGGVAGASLGREGRRVAVMAAAVVLHLLYVVSVGDDGLRVHRFYVPVLAPLAFLVGLLFRPSVPAGGRGSRWLPALGALAVVLAVPASIWTLRGEWTATVKERTLRYQEGNEKLGRRLAETRPPTTVIAVASAGAIPYYSRLTAIDMYGLNDPHIAREPFPAPGRGRMMKWDSAYILARRPDLIVINSGYCRAGDPRAERAARDPFVLVTSPMDRDLFEHGAQDGSYALHRIEFADGSSFYVFERAT